MKKKQYNASEILEILMKRYPELSICKEAIISSYKMLKQAYAEKNKLLVAGNGGSASDSEHIVGELMKSFLFNRKIEEKYEKRLSDLYGEVGKEISQKLEGTLCSIPLTSMPALSTAFLNDVDPTFTFAQMLYGYGVEGDVFLGISTSGNSQNIINALMVARAKNIKTIGLTGKTGGKMKNLCDITICVPEDETFMIQELHLPIYHALCAMLEADFFTEK
ncbi:MAG: SIS domain-containing protein [Paenibacillaceae bacterium]|nr:SIS domain-containing protein [Paenibacillaceae bacterium]